MSCKMVTGQQLLHGGKFLETGYVLALQRIDGTEEYYRGCARGRDLSWAKKLVGAQIYRGYKAAESAMQSCKITRADRLNIKIKKIEIKIIEEGNR